MWLLWNGVLIILVTVISIINYINMISFSYYTIVKYDYLKFLS